ncbi:hypothetical protein A5482_001860 [Cyanobacterium sp. IPPAS B-1200]|uniref:hypothetical protein n=1 Tax=Cyanobacterium sp. IPPAS B-1200 TaxID=1562720 RepID=UPI0008525B91|nr:hypothetical protein [Cyanobacterium sp. IPPAS B-1200]OEJ79508.1 hypothetical protein A5482_01250 [Cyanobacterium sp. IPPAS B-1200]
MVKAKRSNFYFSRRLFTQVSDGLSATYTPKTYRRLCWFLVGLMMVVGDKGLIFSNLGAIALLFFIYNYQGVSFSALQVFSRFFPSHNRRFTLAVAGSGLGAIAFYLSAKIWLEIDSHWLATAIIFQGLISSGTFALLGWYFYQQKNNQKETFEQNINHLIAESPLKRLYGLNQLIHRWETGKLNISQTQYMIDYLLIMKNNETDSIIQEKLNYFLNQINPTINNRSLEKAEKKPLNIPKKYKTKIIINN